MDKNNTPKLQEAMKEYLKGHYETAYNLFCELAWDNNSRGFLFIDGDEGKSYDVYEDGYEEFNQLRIESETSKGVKLPPIEIGFCYYTDKNVRMDFNKEAFCFKHE